MLRRRPWRALLADLLWPGWCLGCGISLRGESATLLLCRICHGKLRPIDLRRHCSRCLRPIPRSSAPRPLCLKCRLSPPRLDLLVAAWSYEPPLSDVLRSFKFGRLEFLAKPLVRAVQSRELFAELPPIDRVVSVPLSLWRRIGRGFNQAESLGRELADRLGVEYSDVLQRRSLLAPRQARLDRRRRLSSLEGELALRRGARRRIAGGALLLVDDIVTTGSTLLAAARILRSAGARTVVGFAVAATPSRRPTPSRSSLDSSCTPP